MKIFKNRRLKGAISIFLVIITIPTMLLSGVLVDGSRMTSARVMAQEGTDLAAASVLASYNQQLKDEFGLFALEENDPGKLKAIFEESLNATLLAHGMSGDAQYSERLWEIMKTTLTGQKSYMGESFLNLYDFNIDTCTIEPLYELANQEVLANQMVEYSKFRGIYIMADRMDIFNELGDIKKDAEKNQVTAEVMEDKVDTDEKNATADEVLADLRIEIDDLNLVIKAVSSAQEEYKHSLKAKMEKIRIENTDTEDRLSSSTAAAANRYGAKQTALKDAAKKACEKAKTVLKKAEKTKKEIEKSIKNLENFCSRNQGKAADNENVRELLQDAENNIELYKKEYLPEVQKIIDDPILNKMKQDSQIKSNLNRVMKDIDEAITKYIKEIEKIRASASEDSEEEIEITDYYYYYLRSSESTINADAVMNRSTTRSYEPAIGALVNYFIGKEWNSDNLDPSRKYKKPPSNKDDSSDKFDEEFAKKQSGKSGNSETNQAGEAKQGSVDEEVYNSRPSKTWNPDEGKKNNTDFYNRDNDLSSSKSILNQGKHSMILDIAEATRDEVLCLSYMFGTFKTRLTGVKKFSSEGMSSEDKNSFYMPKWRYAHPDGELDIRFTPKKDRNTVLRSEIEYLIYGNRSDAANETAVYATIFAERLANNMIAMYADKEVVNPSCHSAAGVASAATSGFVPEAVFFWIFLTAWATTETVIEMNYLISGGYRIPLIKTNENILLNKLEFLESDGQGLIENYGETGVFVSYEDYLLILLLIKGRDKRMMRTEDLIEMNIKKGGDSDFTMANSYTWIHADTKLSIRYLFGNVMPFQETYEKNGYSGRMHFTNTIYQGY